MQTRRGWWSARGLLGSAGASTGIPSHRKPEPFHPAPALVGAVGDWRLLMQASCRAGEPGKGNVGQVAKPACRKAGLATCPTFPRALQGERRSLAFTALHLATEDCQQEVAPRPGLASGGGTAL